MCHTNLFRKGVCDPQSRCPSPLVCIRGDCWQIPDKPLRRPLMRDSVPDSYIISSDDWSDELEEKLFSSPKPIAFHRFVDRHPTFKMTKELLERTTMESPADEASANSMFHVKKSTFKAEEPLLAPSSVSEIVPKRRTTKEAVKSTKTETTTAISSDDEEGLPPAPPPPEEAENHINNWPAVSEDEVARASTKFIELPREEVLKPIPRVEKKVEERKLPDAPSSVFLDPVEFPISSQLDELEKDGIKVEPPKALSVKPTEDELESQKKFERALEQRKRQRKRLKVGSMTTTAPTVKTTSPTLQFESFTTDVPMVTHIAPRRRAPQRRTVGKTAKKEPVYVPPVGELLPGVWYPLEENSIRRSPKTVNPTTMSPFSSSSNTVVITTTSTIQRPFSLKKGKRNLNPVRIDAVVNGHFDDECSSDAQCGRHSHCCLKRWCDKKNFCSTARFCLPSCNSSKMVKPGGVDIVLD